MTFSVKKENLSFQVTEYIKEHLLFSGKYENGQKIAEHEIARALGISRSPIREAFKELQEESLLLLEPKKGAFVVSLTNEDIKEIYLMRFWIEGNLYDMIIEENLLSNAKYEELQADVHRIVDIVESDLEKYEKTAAYTKEALSFHIRLCSLSNKKWIVKILSKLFNQMRLAMARDLRYANDYKKNAYLHYKILASLKEKDGKAAKKILAEDLALYSD